MAGTNVEQINIAIVILSGGSEERFYELLKAAREDWRDVLVGADLCNANWQEVAKKRGVEF